MYPDGVFMGIDSNSGGYPYRAEHPANFKYFDSKKEALEYNSRFKNSFKLVEITFYFKEVV